MLLEHIKKSYRRFDELETEQFGDAMIEARQLVSTDRSDCSVRSMASLAPTITS